MAQQFNQLTLSVNITSATAVFQQPQCDQISLRELLQLSGSPAGKLILHNASPLIRLTLTQEDCYSPDLGYNPLSADLTPEQEEGEAARCKNAAQEIFGGAVLVGDQNKDGYPYHLVPAHNNKEDIDFGLTDKQFDVLLDEAYGHAPEEPPMDADSLGDDIFLGSQSMDASSPGDDISLDERTMDANYAGENVSFKQQPMDSTSSGENISDERPRKRSKPSSISLQAKATSQESKSTYNETAGFENNKERKIIPPTTTKRTDTLLLKKSVKNVFAAVVRKSPNPSSPSKTSSSLPRPVVPIAPRPSQGPSTPPNTNSSIPKPVASIGRSFQNPSSPSNKSSSIPRSVASNASSSQDPWSPFSTSSSIPSSAFWSWGNPQPVQPPALNPDPQSSLRSELIDGYKGQTPTHQEPQSAQRLVGPIPPSFLPLLPPSSFGSRPIDSHESQSLTHRELQSGQRPPVPTPSPQHFSVNRLIETLEARAPTQRELKRGGSHHQRHRSSPSNYLSSANSVQPSFSHRAGSPPHSQVPQHATSLFGSPDATHNSFEGPSTPTYSRPQYYNHNRSGSNEKMSNQSTPTQQSSTGSPTPRKSLLPPPHPSLPPRPAGPLPSFKSHLTAKVNYVPVSQPVTTIREYASIEFLTQRERQEGMKRLQGISHNQETMYKAWRDKFPKYTEMCITCDNDPESKKIELHAPTNCNVRGALANLFEGRYYVSARRA
jgi:hypothetical protein